MRVALVTGAATGIGRAVADHLEADGWAVARNDLPSHQVDFPADVSRPDQVRAMVASVVTQLGSVSLLVNNAATISMGLIEEVPASEFWRIIDTNLFGAFLCAQTCAPAMRERGWGRIVSMTSEWGQIGWPRATAYSASKGGIISLTKALARELGPFGITANAIAPSVVETDGLIVDARDAGVSLDEMKRDYAEKIPLRRLGQPPEIASLVSFLASDAAETLTGQVIAPNGGTTC
jgi:NAD(P)-dependent dehydrogenase (short-subunit alcohol dehydrogenase family)